MHYEGISIVFLFLIFTVCILFCGGIGWSNYKTYNQCKKFYKQFLNIKPSTVSGGGANSGTVNMDVRQTPAILSTLPREQIWGINPNNPHYMPSSYRIDINNPVSEESYPYYDTDLEDPTEADRYGSEPKKSQDGEWVQEVPTILY